MKYIKLLLIVTIFVSTGCASTDITPSSNKVEALALCKKFRGTCKIEKDGIGDGTLNGPIYPFSRWTVKLHKVSLRYSIYYYQPILYLDDNRQETPGKSCTPYYIHGDPSQFVGSLMGLGVNYEKESKDQVKGGTP